MRVARTGKASFSVPCGHCIECLQKYQNNWQNRIVEQFKDSKVGVFFTLTYAEENMPVSNGFGTVFKSDVQSALKRFRTSLKRSSGKTFKYFITSEYGPTTLRPHYHGIFFGVFVDECRPFFSDWSSSKGFVKFDQINCLTPSDAQGVARYVAKYCSKGMFENPRVATGDVLPTFHLISKGLGASYLSPEKINYHLAKGHKKSDAIPIIAERLRYHSVDGFDYTLPRYYRNKIFDGKTNLSYEVSDFLFKKSCDVRDREFRQLQTLHSSDFHETYRLQGLSEIERSARKEQELRSKYGKFLSKSKL